jgi:hypothetical protein
VTKENLPMMHYLSSVASAERSRKALAGTPYNFPKHHEPSQGSTSLRGECDTAVSDLEIEPMDLSCCR